VTWEKRIQKANRGGWNWKQWRQEDGIGRSEGRRMQLTAVEVGRIDWVSHWFENSSIGHETCPLGNERTWPWKDSNCRIGGDSSDESSVVSRTEMRRQKLMSHDT
jgi:hypothetical protein